jgi:hypothetical protein
MFQTLRYGFQKAKTLGELALDARLTLRVTSETF